MAAAFDYIDPELCSSANAAARQGFAGQLKKLVDNGAPLDVRDNRGFLPLHEASESGNLDCLKLLIDWNKVQRCVNIETLDEYINVKVFEGKTAVFIAAEKGKTDVLKLLLEVGASVNHSNLEETTPLVVAIENNNLECVKLCLEYGANPNFGNISNWTALHEAVHCGNLKSLELLLELENIDVDIETNDVLMTPLLYACQSQIPRNDIIKKLLSKGADPNKSIVDESYCALHLTCYHNNVEATELLLQHGANAECFVTEEDGNLLTPLHLACQNQSVDCVKLLLETWNVSPNIGLGKSLNTPLVDTILSEDWGDEEKRAETVLLLLRKGANIEPDLTKIIYHLIARDNAIVFKAICKYINLKEMMFLGNYEESDDVDDAIAKMALSPFHYAAIDRSLNVFSLLLDEVADDAHCVDQAIAPLIPEIYRKWFVQQYYPVYQDLINMFARLIKLNTTPHNFTPKVKCPFLPLFDAFVKISFPTEEMQRSLINRYAISTFQEHMPVPTLKHCCRISLRRDIGYRNLQVTLDQCNLPKRLVSYVMFEE